MQVHEEFMTHKLTLIFETGKQVKLTKEESKELEKWFINKQNERQ